MGEGGPAMLLVLQKEILDMRVMSPVHQEKTMLPKSNIEWIVDHFKNYDWFAQDIPDIPLRLVL